MSKALPKIKNLVGTNLLIPDGPSGSIVLAVDADTEVSQINDSLRRLADNEVIKIIYPRRSSSRDTQKDAKAGKEASPAAAETVNPQDDDNK